MTTELEYHKAKNIVTIYEQRARDNKDYDIEKGNKKRIGTYWKYTNSYGSGDTWPLYLQVRGVNGTSLVTIEYQLTAHDKAEVEENEKSCYNESGLGYGWSKISKSEFIKGRDKVLQKLGLRVDC